MASLPKSFLCLSVRIVPSNLFAGIFLNDSHTHADLAASANSPSRTVEDGSRVFIKLNTAPTSHGQFSEFSDWIISPPEIKASSNDFTIGSLLKLVLVWLYCVNCLSLNF